MAAGHDDPAVQRRRLRVELRKARLDAGMTQRDVADAMDWSTSKLIRIENGEVRVSRNDLRALLEHYGITEKRRVDALIEMARVAREESWSKYRDVHSQPFLTYLGLESSAWVMRVFETVFVPGLLQTEEYNDAIQTEAFYASDEVSEKRWSARDRRQRLHDRDGPPQMFFLVDEAVVRRRVGGPGVMRRQIQRMLQLGAEPHVTLRVVSFGAGASPGMQGPFTLLEFRNPDDDDMLYLEPGAGITTRDDREATADHLERFYELEKIALPADETTRMLEAIAAEMTAEARPAQEPAAS